MSDTVIRVENLWKQYRLGTINHGTLKADLASWWARMRGHEDPNLSIDQVAKTAGSQDQPDRFWALKDINFEVKQGEVLGIIGKNGAGKSTLLKILSRVTTPTRGQIKVRGRIASLLEVGTGFHPELTGRENIFLNGAILGMNKAEIFKKLDEIIAFAEVEKFIDTPVKRYSSGMYVRLAFAVAAHLEPEILVVDEVLAVGDAEFQKKCLGKMGDVASHGRTVLFVSHNMGAIRHLCNEGLMLSGGQVAVFDDVDNVLTTYLSSDVTSTGKRKWAREDAPGDEDLKLVSASVTCQKEVETHLLDEKTIVIELQIIAAKVLDDIALGIEISTSTGSHVLHTVSNIRSNRDRLSEGINIIRFSMPPYTLCPGQYSLTLSATKPNVHIYFHENNLLNFVVETHNQQILRYPTNAWRSVLSPLIGSWVMNERHMTADCEE